MPCPRLFYLCSSRCLSLMFAWERRSLIRLEPRFAELAATTNFSFPARSLASRGDGRARRRARPCRDRDRRPQLARRLVRAHAFARDNAEAMAAMRVVTGARLVFIDGCPTSSLIPKIAPPTAGSAGSRPRAICARPKANAGSPSTIFWSAARACRSWRCDARPHPSHFCSHPRSHNARRREDVPSSSLA